MEINQFEAIYSSSSGTSRKEPLSFSSYCSFFFRPHDEYSAALWSCTIRKVRHFFPKLFYEHYETEPACKIVSQIFRYGCLACGCHCGSSCKDTAGFSRNCSCCCNQRDVYLAAFYSWFHIFRSSHCFLTSPACGCLQNISCRNNDRDTGVLFSSSNSFSSRSISLQHCSSYKPDLKSILTDCLSFLIPYISNVIGDWLYGICLGWSDTVSFGKRGSDRDY
jgi:hypothetical protein